MTVAASPKRTFGRKILKGGAWTLGGAATSNVLRLGSNLVMTRLLAPEAFGLMAIAGALQFWMTMMSDIGLNASVMRAKDPHDATFLSTVYWTQFARNALMALVLASIGLSLYPLGAGGQLPEGTTFADPRLPLFIFAAALAVFISGFSAMRTALYQRALDIGPLTQLELASQVVAFAAMASAAYFGFGPLSLGVGLVVNALARTIGSFTHLKGPPISFSFDRGHFRTLIDYGKWILISSTVGALTARGAQLIFGWTFDVEPYSYYAVATIWVLAAGGLVNSVIQRITFPVFAEVQRDRPEDLRATYVRLRTAAEAASIALFVGAFAFSPWLVDVLYEDRYAPVADYLQLLSVGFLLFPLKVLPIIVLADGDSRRFFVGSVLSGVALVAGVLTALMFAGPKTAVALSAIAPAVAAPYNVWIARSRVEVSYWRECAAAVAALIAAPLVIAVV